MGNVVIECADPATCQAVAEQMGTAIRWLVNATITAMMVYGGFQVVRVWWRQNRYGE